MIETLIKNVALGDAGTTTSLGIQSGRFVFVNPASSIKAKWELDAQGCLMLPGLIEPRAYLDRCYNTAFSAPTSIQDRARRGIERAISKGVCYLRAQVSMVENKDLDALRALLELREEYKNRIQIEFTLVGTLDTSSGKLLAESALKLGAHCIGGVPARSKDPAAAIDHTLSFAAEFDCPIDLHIDETENPENSCLEYLADRVLEAGVRQPVVASHCSALGFMNAPDRKRIINKVCQAGIHVVALTSANLHRLSRVQPSPRGATAINELLQAGANVCAGVEDVQNAENPWGDFEPLGTASLTANAAQLQDSNPFKSAINLITFSAATAMGVKNYGVTPGNIAHFCLLRCTNFQQALAERSLRTWVFYEGRPVIRQTLEQIWIDEHSSKTTLINPL